MWIDAGSRYENEKNNGTAHFLEHMSFKAFNFSVPVKKTFREHQIEPGTGLNLRWRISEPI